MPSITRVLTVVGARPQFVKAAVVSRALRDHGDMNEVLVHTGQHFDNNMSDVFFHELDILAPKFNLGIGGGSHGENTGRALQALERVMDEERPDCVLVYGDTDSTLAGALAAAKMQIPIVHVEAGLRSFNRRMPEEINRVLTDHLSSLLFAPSPAALKNLDEEGIRGEKVKHVGDVMFDAVRIFTDVASRRSQILGALDVSPGRYALATVHRKENTDDPEKLRQILEGLSHSAMRVILPLHPRTRKRLSEFGLQPSAAIEIVEPVGYLDMLWLERNAAMILTDSGGVQKEAYFHGVPCATLREETEWVELVDGGFNRLVGADVDAIARALREHSFPTDVPNIYGSGYAANEIASILGAFR
nr:UDP-N-acetylglucosamine 2-epimerase (non-hydrolyzing) [Afipia sp. P52-10]